MHIITATGENLDELVPLFDGYRIFYKQTSDPDRSRVFLSERFKNKDSVIFIAYNDQNEAIGFTQLYPLFSSVSMKPLHVLNDLYVSKKVRGKGVGRSLLDFAKKYISEIDGKGLILETAKDNPAQHLYEDMGWKQDNEFLHYTWINK